MADDPGFCAEKIIHQIHQERNLIKHCAAQGEGLSTLISQTKLQDRKPTICSHCHQPGHTAKFCISPGGKFTGHSLKEAHIAQHTAWAKERAQRTSSSMNTQRTTSSVNIATTSVAMMNTQNVSRPPSPTPLTTMSNTMQINGVTWVPRSSTADMAQIALGPIVEPNFEFTAYQANHDEDSINHHVSIDWNEFSFPSDKPHTFSAYNIFPAHKVLYGSPFILDSGASCHISPKQSDFKMLTPTAPHPITRFVRSCVYATGIGTIEF